MPRHKALLINFVPWERPSGIDELLMLLDLTAAFDYDSRMHHIYQNPGVYPPRYSWGRREFRGGTQEEWSKFLSEITSAGWYHPPASN